MGNVKRIKIEPGEQVEIYFRKPGTTMVYSSVSTDHPQPEPRSKTMGLRASLVLVGPCSISIVKSGRKK
jgi:hypothetical protein